MKRLLVDKGRVNESTRTLSVCLQGRKSSQRKPCRLVNLLTCLLLLFLASCGNGAHDGEYPLTDGQGALIVGLQTVPREMEISHLALYLFGEDGSVALFGEYTDPRVPASQYFSVAAGTYTLVVLANVDPSVLPGQTTLADLAQWLKEQSAQYPDLLTASTQTDIPADEVTRLLLTLAEGTEGISLSTLRLVLTVPDDSLPAYTRAATDEGSLRLVAEVLDSGTGKQVHRRTQLCTPQADGTHLAELSLLPGDYDLRLWADWVTDGTTADKYYNADDLTSVTVLTDNYVANGQTDEKDAYYATLSATLADGEQQDCPVSLVRPFARYRLVATDVQGYLNLIEKENYPPIENLDVRVSYSGYFPTAFNVATGKPVDALTGIGYAAEIIAATGYDTAEARQVGADYVLTNGGDSSVSVSIELTDRATGLAVSTVRSVNIPYRRGHLTTVCGHFLTAGRTTGGVAVDTDWGDEIIVEF